MDYKTMTDDEYNNALPTFGNNYRLLNTFVMKHTNHLCKTDERLVKAINNTISKQFVLYEEDWNDGDINKYKDGQTTNIIISKKRTYEAASSYKCKKVAVLNFANNHSIGGSPYTAGAQEESLCRTSTLYRCLKNEEQSFYNKHRELGHNPRFRVWGNGDLIYSPDVVVFKTDESAPKMMPEDKWFKVDVVTMAAPEFRNYETVYDFDYGPSVLARMEKVFEVAKKQGVEVLILGAWGCGAFHNPPEIVAKNFKYLCGLYHFDTVEFAVYCRDDDPNNNYNVFKNILLKE